MVGLKAIVRDGRAVIENLDGYADDTVLELAIIDDGSELDAVERARLDAAIERGAGQAQRGETVPWEDVLRDH
jgi:hypothetical protein